MLEEIKKINREELNGDGEFLAPFAETQIQIDEHRHFVSSKEKKKNSDSPSDELEKHIERALKFWYFCLFPITSAGLIILSLIENKVISTDEIRNAQQIWLVVEAFIFLFPIIGAAAAADAIDGPH